MTDRKKITNSLAIDALASTALAFALLAIIAFALTACGPDLASGGSEGFGDTGGPGLGVGLEGDGDPGDTGSILDAEPPADVGCGGGPGCECSAGECAAGLVCDFSETCSQCPPGYPGCPCEADDSCKVGECTQGENGDGTSWSICYPADLLGCEIDPCPGDAHCTDDLKCAWID